MTEPEAVRYRPADPDVLADPYPVFRSLREHDPVHRCDDLQAWIVTRYDDVKGIALNDGFSADRLRPFFASLPDEARSRIPDLIRYLTQWLVFRDPPDHTRVRRFLNRAFTPRLAQTLRPRVEALVAGRFEALEASPAPDLVRDFAAPLPAQVIMALLGVPDEALDDLKAWSDEVALFVGSARASEDKYRRAQAGARALADLFGRLIRERRERPTGDLLGRLLDAREAGRLLTEDELVGTCILLLFAGHETTTNLLVNGVRALLEHRAQFERLCAEPALAARAVEECLRYDTPVTSLPRVVVRPQTLRGRRLARGDRVFAMQAAANRDPAVFEHPESLDVGRDPNPHLAFGHGIHLCLGAPLARLEAAIAFTGIARRYPRMQAAGGRLEWFDSVVFRGLRAFPVRLS